MDTNTNDYILVLEDKESKKLSVVSSVDAEGNVQTVEPLDAHSGQFMKLRMTVFSRTSWRTLLDSLMILQEPDFTDLLQIKWKVL